MAGPLDFTGQNIEDSYQRVLQTDGTIITDGTGSFVNLQFTGSFSGSFEGLATSASLATTASYIKQAESASFVVIGQGAGITVSGMTVAANLLTINGNGPDENGNVAVSLAAVLTGTSASLASYATGGLAEGTVWIVSNDSTPEKNGTSYVYDSGSVGVWYQIAPLDQTAADARYARVNTATVQNLTASFSTTASFAESSSYSLSSSFSTTASFARSASFATTASYSALAATASIRILDEGTLRTSTPTSINFVGDGVTTTNTGTDVTVTIPGGGGGGAGWPYYGNAVISGSLAVTGSVSNLGTLNNNGVYQIGPWYPTNNVNILTYPTNINGVTFQWVHSSATTAPTVPPNTPDIIYLRFISGLANNLNAFSASFNASKSHADYVSRLGHLTIVSASYAQAGTNLGTDSELIGGGLFIQNTGDVSRATTDTFVKGAFFNFNIAPATRSLSPITPARIANEVQLTGSLLVSASGVAFNRIIGSTQITGSLNGISFLPTSATTIPLSSSAIVWIANSFGITGSLNVSSSINGLAINTNSSRTSISSSAPLITISNSTQITGSLLVSGSNSTINNLTINPLKNSTTNIAIGIGSLSATSGLRNIGIGSGSNIGGNQADNVAIGISALTKTGNTGTQNLAIGNYALQNNTSAGNVGIGHLAGADLVGQGSTAIGRFAMQYAVASFTIAIGNSAAAYNTGSNGVFIGGAAGRLSNASSIGNVAVGNASLSGDPDNGRNFSGDYNFAMGYRALGYGQFGSANTALGSETLLRLETGSYNIALGYNSAGSLLKGSQNFFLGFQAGTGTQYGDGVIAIGTQAARNLYQNTSFIGVSTNIIAIGGGALGGSTNNVSTDHIAIGTNAMSLHAMGNTNIAIGNSVMQNNITGSRNIVLGYQAAYNSSAVTNISDNIVIGHNATPQLNGQGNIIIGHGAQVGTSTDRLHISSGSGNPLIGGDFAAKTVTISGSLLMSGSIIPNVGSGTTTSSFSLGSPTAAWKGIYVSSGSVHFVDSTGTELAKISADPSGQIIVPNIYTDGTFTAQTFVTQSTTTIIEIFHATGSNKFGSSSLDTHQFTGSVYISGGLDQVSGNTSFRNTTINGSLTAVSDVYLSSLSSTPQTNVLTYDAGSGRIYYTSSNNVINSNAFATTASNTFYGTQTIYDSSNTLSIVSSQATRRLYDASGLSSIDWGTRNLIDVAGFSAFDFQNRQLQDETQQAVIELSNGSAVFPLTVKLTGTTQDPAGLANSVVLIDTATSQLYTTTSISLTAGVQAQVDSLTAATSSYITNSGSAVITGSLAVGLEGATALYTTATGSANTETITVYSLSTASYDSLFLDYTMKSGVNMRAGQMTATWLGGSIVYNEIATVDIGSTAGANLTATLTDSTASINFTAPSSGWTIKTIVRSI
jgi:hypothetical protein